MVRAVLFAADPMRGAAFLDVLAAEGYDVELRLPEPDRPLDASAPAGCAIAFLDLALGLDRVRGLCRAVLAPAAPIPPLVAVLGEPGLGEVEALVAAGANLYVADDLPAIARRARFLHDGLRNRIEESDLLRRLGESEDRHRALIDALAEGVIIRARDRSYATINPAAARLLGLTPDEVAARSFPRDAFELLDPDERPWPRPAELFDQVQAAGQTVHIREVGIRRRDGTIAWAEVYAHPLRDPITGEQIAVVATLTDRSQRRRVRAQLFALLEGIPEAVLIHERDRVLWVNQNLCTLLGYPGRAALVGRETLDLVPERFHDVARARLGSRAEAREVPPAEHPLRRRDGSEVTVRLLGMPILFDDRPALLTFASDLSEREQLETQLAAADRLAALGRLAASVGHEINNPLTYVMGNLELALRRVRGVDARLAELLDEALAGAERMRQIVRDLRVFSQADRLEIRAVDLRQVIASCVRMTESEVQHRARLVEQLEPVPPVAGSEARIAQVITNLLLNAAQAIPDDRGGDAQITIAARLAPDDRVELAIEDTGVGIAPEHVPHVFDPFFTTKTATGGTGLGMSVCRMLVAAEGGEIDVASELGRGTRVTVRWPRARQAAPAQAAPAAPRVARTRRRILLIDDERRVVEALRGGLVGHEVTVALGGITGLALAEGSGPFDAIVCDLMMPELSGMELYSRLAAARPGLERRIVFVTAGAFTPRAARFLAGVPNACLEKPFGIERLVDAIEEAIVRANPANPR